MKNSNVNNGQAVVSTSNETTIKKQVQNGAVVAIQCATYPAVLALQTAADLLNLGQANLVKVIDGTPVLESMKECETWTQTQQAHVVNAGMKVRERFLRQREANRKHDIEKTKALLDKLEGVEQIPSPKIVANASTEPKAVQLPSTEAFEHLTGEKASTQPIAPTTEAPAIVQTIVPIAPVVSTQHEVVTVPIPPAPAPVQTTRKPRTSASANKPLPTMTAETAFVK